MGRVILGVRLVGLPLLRRVRLGCEGCGRWDLRICVLDRPSCMIEIKRKRCLSCLCLATGA